MSRYLPWLCTALITGHSYFAYLSAKKSKDLLLQGVASVGLLSAVLLLLALILQRYYKRTATVLFAVVTVILLAALLKSYLWTLGFWLALTGFAWLICLVHTIIYPDNLINYSKLILLIKKRKNNNQ